MTKQAVTPCGRDHTHQGWANYETWVTKLWMDNEEGSQSYWAEAARNIRKRAPSLAEVKAGTWTATEAACFRLADQLKNEFEVAMDEMMDRGRFTATLWGDLLSSALCEVDWAEIASALLEE